MAKIKSDYNNLPNTQASVSKLFGFESKLSVPAYKEPSEHVPDIDDNYL